MERKNGEYQIHLNGVKHWVKVDGFENKTTPLVIIHGGPGGNHYTFEHTVGPFLAKERTVVYYEQRGCGRSEKPISDTDYTIELLTKDFIELKNWLKTEKVDLLGYSFGGELAFEIASAIPNDINKIVVSGPSLLQSNIQQIIQIQGFMSVANSKILGEIEEILEADINLQEKYNKVWSFADHKLVDQLLFENQEIAKLNRRLWEESKLTNTGLMIKVLQENPPKQPLLERLNRIEHKTLIISGVFDRNTGLSISKLINNRLNDSHIELFLHSAHFPDLEETEKFVKVTIDFLN